MRGCETSTCAARRWGLGGGSTRFGGRRAAAGGLRTLGTIAPLDSQRTRLTCGEGRLWRRGGAVVSLAVIGPACGGDSQPPRGCPLRPGADAACIGGRGALTHGTLPRALGGLLRPLLLLCWGLGAAGGRWACGAAGQPGWAAPGHAPRRPARVAAGTPACAEEPSTPARLFLDMAAGPGGARRPAGRGAAIWLGGAQASLQEPRSKMRSQKLNEARGGARRWFTLQHRRGRAARLGRFPRAGCGSHLVARPSLHCAQALVGSCCCLWGVRSGRHAGQHARRRGGADHRASAGPGVDGGIGQVCWRKGGEQPTTEHTLENGGVKGETWAISEKSSPRGGAIRQPKATHATCKPSLESRLRP